MPPKKAEEAEEPLFVFEKDRMIKKFHVDNYIARQNVPCIDVPIRPKKDPAEKLKERLDTYHNLRKMKTEYKNYVHRYGTPPFYVPENIKKIFINRKCHHQEVL